MKTYGWFKELYDKTKDTPEFIEAEKELDMEYMELEDCDCKLWKECVKTIDMALDMLNYHDVTDDYNMVQFFYCPWCGKERQKKAEEVKP